MRPLRDISIALALALLALPPAAAGQEPDAVVARADGALEALSTLEADFVQRVENPILERTEIGHGTLLYRAPDRFRVAYGYPAGDVVVNDGTWVWIYLPSSQPGQVIRQPAEAAGVRNPLTFLREVRDAYAIEDAGVEALAGGPADRLVLTPTASDAAFERVDVWVDRRTGLPRQIRTATPDGVVRTTTFTSLERNVRIGPDVFRFRVPPGVEVFDS